MSRSEAKRSSCGFFSFQGPQLLRCGHPQVCVVSSSPPASARFLQTIEIRLHGFPGCSLAAVLGPVGFKNPLNVDALSYTRLGVPGGKRAQRLVPNSNAFQAHVARGSMCRPLPERAGPITNHLFKEECRVHCPTLVQQVARARQLTSACN